MKYDYLIDLFSGAGGFTLGLQQAGMKFKQVFYSDIDKYANAVYKYRFSNHIAMGDIEKVEAYPVINGKAITTHDLKGITYEEIEVRTPTGTFRLQRCRGIITFGFPCQDLSIAGKREGLDGNRSGLFYQAIRIIRILQPKVFIFENVKGLFSADEGQAFVNVLREIADIGLYDCEWQLVNTRWVLPQNRERIYFIGHFRGRSEPKVFPIRESIKGINEGTKQSAVVRSLQGGGHSGGHHSGMTLLRWQNKKDGIVKGENAPTLRSSGGTDIRKRPVIAIDLKTAHGSSKTRRGGISKDKTPALDHNCSIGIHSTYRHAFKGFKGYEDISVPIKSSEGSGNQILIQSIQRCGDRDKNTFSIKDDVHCLSSNPMSDYLPKITNGNNIRRLTPTECERLQGFPDNWTKYGKFLKPSVQKYVFGNIDRRRNKNTQYALYLFAINNTTLIDKEISDTQRYKLMGNAVTVDIVEMIGERLNV